MPARLRRVLATCDEARYKQGMLASTQATAAYAATHPELPQNFRLLDGLHVSSLGIGTYLGRDNQADDDSYQAAILYALAYGINVIDTAINYRAQRSERLIGHCLRQLGSLGLYRQQLVLSTKAGYLPFDGTVPQNGEDYLRRVYLNSGLAPPAEVVDGRHCLAPEYLRDQLTRSLRNLGVSGVDIFYLHNPETQLGAVARPEFRRRMRAAFALCEELAGAGLIGRYGCATWSGFRVAPTDPGHLSLGDLHTLATELAGDQHHFRIVQLPVNLAMTEAIRQPTQVLDGQAMTLLQAAERLGIAVVASGTLGQGKLLGRPLPDALVAAVPGLRRDSQRLLQIVRSAPGITTALCGFKTLSHARENLELLRTPPLSQQQFARLL
jgi:aryl-alcohol dehydrogenase-like predicted oxidoreductase